MYLLSAPGFLEEKVIEADYKRGSKLLRYFFEISYKKFEDNPDYLFFISRILFIGEWFFGLDDDNKPMEERFAFKMQNKAWKLKPDTLFKWACLFSLNDNSAD